MPPVMRRMAFAPPPSPDIPPQEFPSPDVTQQGNHQIDSSQMRRMAHNPPADLTTSTSIPSTQQTPSLPRNNPRHKRNMRAQDDSDVPRSQPYNPPRQKLDIPEKFITKTKEETIAPTSTLEVDVAATTTATTTRITHSKMNDLQIPKPPIWFPYILAILILSGFVLAGVLACATFPQETGRFCRSLTSWRCALWRRMGRGRGRYHSIEDEDSDSDGLENVETSAKSSSSPELEMGIMRKRNHKNLRVKTKGIAYSGLGIGVRGRGSAGSSSAANGHSAVGSAVSSAVASARDLLFGGKVEGLKKDDDAKAGGFLDGVASHVESAAGWWARLLHGEVRGAEEGLLFDVRDCEREGFVGRDGVRVGVGRREAF